MKQKLRTEIGWFVLLFIFQTASSVLAQNEGEESTIIWNEARPLTWADFRGEVTENPASAAQSWVGIGFFGKCLDGKFSFEANAFFHKDSSWVVDRKKSGRLLLHEQGHFDIAEIFAIKLRKTLSEIADPCKDMDKTQSEINSLIEANKVQLQQEQEAYDVQTEHGKNKKKQKKWLKRIKEQLNKN